MLMDDTHVVLMDDTHFASFHVVELLCSMHGAGLLPGLVQM